MILTLHFNRGSERYKRKALRGNASDAEQELWQQLKGKRLGKEGDTFHRISHLT